MQGRVAVGGWKFSDRQAIQRMLVWLPFGCGGRLIACPPHGYQDRSHCHLPGLCYAGVTRHVGPCERHDRCLRICQLLALPAIVYWQGKDLHKAVEAMTGKFDVLSKCSCGRVSYVEYYFGAGGVGLFLGLWS